MYIKELWLMVERMKNVLLLTIMENLSLAQEDKTEVQNFPSQEAK